MRVLAFIAMSTMRRSGYFTSVFELRPVGCSHDSSRYSWSSSLARLNWSTDPLRVPSIDSCPTEGGSDSLLLGCAMVVHLVFILISWLSTARATWPTAFNSLTATNYV